MLLHQLRNAWRVLIRQKGYTVIHVAGLSLGICAGLVIYLITSHELSYDRFHPDAQRIYRLVGQQRDEEHQQEEGLGFMIIPLPLAMRNELSGFDAVTEFHHYYGRVTVPAGSGEPRRFDATRLGEGLSPIIIAEPNYFDLFKYKWLAGNPRNALDDPFTVVLTEKQASRYFGAQSPDRIIGKDLYYGDIFRQDSLHVRVAGIVQDWEGPTDLAFTDFLSFATIAHSWLKDEIHLDHWGNWSPLCQAFVRLSPGVTPAQVERQFPGFVKSHVPPYPGHTIRLDLQPLSDLHFNNNYRDQYPRKAHLPALYALMGIAAFILLIAAMNFINLSTARSMVRSKEIGVRKVLGSSRAAIRRQFLLETGVLMTIALIVSVALSYPALSLFRDFIPSGVRVTILNPSTVLFLLAMALVTTLLAGLYPSRVLSGYRPALVLKGQTATPHGTTGRLRKSLIVFQFTISLLFIICAAVIGNQVHYMLNKDLGFRKDAIITFRPAWHDPADRLNLFAQQVSRIAEVTDVTTHLETPAAARHDNTWIRRRDAPDHSTPASYEICDDHYLSLFGLTLLAGRNLGHSDSTGDFLINESAMKALGFHRPEDALGHPVEDGNDTKGFIIGVVRDFNAQSLHNTITPFYFTANRDREKVVSIRLGAHVGSTGSVDLPASDRSVAGLSVTMAQVEKVWKSVYPDETFEYSFFDQTIERLYRTEKTTSGLMNTAMVIAILISCMGLFGLTAFTAGQRAREIAIRKALGAGMGRILILLNRDLIRLVGIAALIASPIAWYAMHRWLQDFAYRIPVSAWLFAIAALSSLALALLTTCFQTLKAARANPIDGLRNE